MIRIGHAASYPKPIPAAALVSSSLLALTLITVIACTRKKPETKAEASSTIQITSTNSGPLIIRTPSAEFRFDANGYLQASLLRGGEALTLDDPPQASSGSSSLTIGGKEISDFAFDLEHAKIGAASGRLGSVGKQIEISGKTAAAPDIKSTALLEVYDSFPNVVLSSISFKNSGEKDASLDKITTQRHLLNASLSDKNAAPYSMWSFHG